MGKLISGMTSKKMWILILWILFVPLLVFFVVFNIVTFNAVNKNLYSSNKDVVSFYQKNLETNLSKIELNLVEIVADNINYKMLLNEVSEADAFSYAYNINEYFDTLLDLYPQISGLYIYSEKNGIQSSNYQDGYDFETKMTLKESLSEMIANKEQKKQGGWMLKEVEGEYYLFRILGIRETYLACAISLTQLQKLENDNNLEGLIMFASQEGESYTILEESEERGIELDISGKSYNITGNKQKYFVVHSRVGIEDDLNVVYIVPYQGILNVMDRMQAVLVVLSLFMIVLIPLCYRILAHFFIRPLEQLVATMNYIKSGRIDTKMNSEYMIREFQDASITFNEMMGTIKELKIQSYEKERELQKVQLQYLQIQIRPHFFLNCLKNIYGMAQTQKYKEIQDMIVMLSKHSRYMFRNNFVLVPIRTELEMVENYINLQNISSNYNIVYESEVDPELLQIPIPQMSILTFVENSVKHGLCIDKMLKIFIKVHLLSSKEGNWINITIMDNGKGFSKESLERINRDIGDDEFGEHIGINNVKRRIALIYADKSDIMFSNQNNGACVEMFIPYEKNKM